jgi:hypothetical protein
MNTEDPLASWKPLKDVPADELREARLQAHWAVQPLGAFGRALAEPRPDDSQTSLSWLDERGVFAGAETPQGLRASLELKELELRLEADGEQETLALPGRTLTEALTWLTERGVERTGGKLQPALELPGYEMPEHPVGKGAPFVAVAALEQLARWYGNAAAVAEMTRKSQAGASAVRCWPHHFDLATLIALDPEGTDAEKARTIGVGLSPGDGSYDEPYFYVTPWPRPDGSYLPELDGYGIWHTEDWVGAVLPASRLVELSSASDQVDRVRAFVDAALFAAGMLLLQD